MTGILIKQEQARAQVQSSKKLQELLAAVEVAAQSATPEQLHTFHDNAIVFVRSATPFRFLDLPAELRNRIYQLVLVSKSRPLIPSACEHSNRTTAVQPALSRVSRLVRTESLPIFYSLNTFIYHVHRFDFGFMLTWLTSIGSVNRRSLRKIELTLMDRMKCGTNLLDYVRWCVTDPDVDDLVLSYDTQEWYDVYGSTGDDKGLQLEMDDTEFILSSALMLAGNLKTEGKLSERRVRREFRAWLEGDRFIESRWRCNCAQKPGGRRLNGGREGYCSYVFRSGVDEDTDPLIRGCDYPDYSTDDD